MSLTYLTTTELAVRIKYHPRTIRDSLVDNVLFEGQHYIRPFHQKKLLFIWENIEKDMNGLDDSFEIPMANGGVCYG
jgi:hypothetical protein